MTNREKFNQKILSLSDEQLAAVMNGSAETCDICMAQDFCSSDESANIPTCKKVLMEWFKKETDPFAQRLEMINEDVAKAAEV